METDKAPVTEEMSDIELTEPLVCDDPQVDAEENTAEQMEEATAQLDLQEVVSSEQAEALAESILQHRNSDLEINAANVTRIDTTCVEVLLSAARLWAADHTRLTIASCSDEFSTAIGLLGLDQTNLESGEI